ncbi:glycosyltransferase [Plesiomonas shigelloides]|uniref:glycosyltransferase n=1 Tax=Plesiomonas shigelloides TaxID=703 RepID=UPI003EB985EE
MKYDTILAIDNLVNGGAENVLVTYANTLARAGLRVGVLVICSSHENMACKLDDDVNLITLGNTNVRFSFIKTIFFLRRIKADNIISFNHQVALLIYICNFFSFRNFIIGARCINVMSRDINSDKRLLARFIYKPLYLKIYRKFDFYIAQCLAMKEDLVSYLNIDEAKIHVIYNPIQEYYTSLDDKSVTNVFVREKKVALFVGRFCYQKGIDELVEVVRKTIAKDPSYYFIFIGEGTEKYKIEELKSEYPTNLILPKKRVDLSLYYKQVSVVILTSRYEGFPNVLNEALTCSCPVIAFDCPTGPSEIIKDGFNGYLLDERDTTKFTDKIFLIQSLADNIRPIALFNKHSLCEIVSRYK